MSPPTPIWRWQLHAVSACSTSFEELDLTDLIVTQLFSPQFRDLQPGESSPFDYSIVNWVLHASFVAADDDESNVNTTIEELWKRVRIFSWEAEGLFQQWTRVFPLYERSHQGNCMYLPQKEGNSLSEKIHPLHVAASYGLSCIFDHPDAFEFNITDGQKYTPLIWAATSNQQRIAKFLLEKEVVEINGENIEGRSALIVSAEHNYSEIVALLLKRNDLIIQPEDKVKGKIHAVSISEPDDSHPKLTSLTVQCLWLGYLEWPLGSGSPTSHPTRPQS